MPLLKGLGIEGGESTGYSLPPPTIPGRPETRTRNLWVISPTLYPLGHDCPCHTDTCTVTACSAVRSAVGAACCEGVFKHHGLAI